jgi:hypothetical protein
MAAVLAVAQPQAVAQAVDQAAVAITILAIKRLVLQHKVILVVQLVMVLLVVLELERLEYMLLVVEVVQVL